MCAKFGVDSSSYFPCTAQTQHTKSVTGATYHLPLTLPCTALSSDETQLLQSDELNSRNLATMKCPSHLE